MDGLIRDGSAAPAAPDPTHHAWAAACAALVTGEQSGLPDSQLETLADEIISCRLRLAAAPGVAARNSQDALLPLFHVASAAG